jgi:uncharacterized protein (TIGR03085 family)
LADLLDDVGPDAATLCEGWRTRDLAAHLVLREGRPAAIGIAVKPFGPWTKHAQDRLSRGDYGEMVDRFRSGPPRLSAMRLPHADVALNTFEHFVHHEDVRRASPHWVARELPLDDQDTLWQQLVKRARWYLRSTPVRLSLVAPDHGLIELGHGREDGVTLTGAPAELVLHIHGRRQHCQVAIAGSGQAQMKWERHEQRL